LRTISYYRNFDPKFLR